MIERKIKIILITITVILIGVVLGALYVATRQKGDQSSVKTEETAEKVDILKSLSEPSLDEQGNPGAASAPEDLVSGEEAMQALSTPSVNAPANLDPQIVATVDANGQTLYTYNGQSVTITYVNGQPVYTYTQSGQPVVFAQSGQSSSGQNGQSQNTKSTPRTPKPSVYYEQPIIYLNTPSTEDDQ